MAEGKKKNETEGMAAQEQPRPNRDAYKKMFAEDYPDMDFEDKETRYGQMLNDRNQLRNYRESGKQLNSMLDKNRWLAQVLQELANNPDMNPLEAIAQSGIDINEAMKVAAAEALAGLVGDELSEDYIIPAAFDPRVGPAVAKAVAEAARRSGVARI